ncbi:MAG: hypothetical protein ACMG6S_35215 [Byssovorax sp.]
MSKEGSAVKVTVARMQDLIDASAAATLFSELDIPIKTLAKSLGSAPWDKG